METFQKARSFNI